MVSPPTPGSAPPLPGQSFSAEDVQLRSKTDAPFTSNVPGASLPAEINPQSSPNSPSANFPPLVMVVLWMMGGILLDRWLAWPLYQYGMGTVFLFVLWWLRWGKSSRAGSQDYAGSLLLGGVVMLLMACWHHDRYFLYPANDLSLMQGEFPQPVCIQAQVMQSPRIHSAPPQTPLSIIPRGDTTDLVVWVQSIRTAQVWKPASGWADVTVNGHLLGVEAGDQIQILGTSSRPRPPLNTGEIDFSFFQRMRRTMVRIRADFPESITKLQEGSWFSPRRQLGRIRSAGLASLRQHISHERSHLAGAILLGAREQLDSEENDGFLVTGTIHILSISGLHVGILAYGFWLLFRTGLLPRKASLLLAMAASLLYAILTGGEPPVIRATIMVQVVCLAMLLSRRPRAASSLALAAIVVLLQNPVALFSARTQLSFLAVATMFGFDRWLASAPVEDPLDRLIAVTRPWHEKLRTRIWTNIVQVTQTGLLVWLTSLPLVWYQYHLISPVAVPLGPIVWLPISLTLFAGFGVLLFAGFAPPLASACGYLTDKSLQLIELAIAWGKWPSGSYAWLPSPPMWWILLFYVALAWIILRPAIQKRPLLLLTAAFGWVLLGWIFAKQFPRDVTPIAVAQFQVASTKQTVAKSPKPLRCTFVAVGHGTSVLLEFPHGKRILYDAGRMGSPQSAIRPIAAVLWERGITHLDGVMISHADSDHFCAVPELLKRFSVGKIYVTPPMLQNQEPAMRDVYTAIRAAKIPIESLASDSVFQLDPSVTTQILHPPPQGVRGSDNANSLVLLLRCGEHSLLLPGDLESPGLEDLLQQQEQHCSVIMAPHHGSRRSDPVGLALWAQPKWVVISGKRDREDVANIARVRDSYEARGAQTLHTAESGTVQVILSEEGVQLKTYHLHKVRSP
ncbi:MAG: ComEC/Rec2 family competence protein [Planctomycetaceae bacterium]